MNVHRKIALDLENTGRVTSTIHPEAARILFGEITSTVVENELNHIVEVDLAHIVMMQECGLIESAAASALTRRIRSLRASGFAALLGAPSLRGAFMLYENFVISETGESAGGMLQAGRSRNDLGATVLRLRLRQELAIFCDHMFSLQEALLKKASENISVILPAYTHYQAALPTTLGHYLSGIAATLDRDLDALTAMFDELDICPLGAGAICGTSFPTNPARTAELLGFAETSTHAVDAIASRNVVLRLLAGLTVVSTTLSRLGHDLQLWTTAEFGFLHIPDDMVGISSMMPQKRNVYMLENIKGLCAAPLGAFSTAAMAQHNTPFSNSIAVGTESTKPVWGALNCMSDAATLTRLLVASAIPVKENMRLRLELGQTNATALAEWIVQRHKAPFRQVHHEVGRVVRDVMAGSESDLLSGMQRRHPQWFSQSTPDLSADAIIRTLSHGAGPAPENTKSEMVRLIQRLDARQIELTNRRQKWAKAHDELTEITAALV